MSVACTSTHTHAPNDTDWLPIRGRHREGRRHSVPRPHGGRAPSMRVRCDHEAIIISISIVTICIMYYYLFYYYGYYVLFVFIISSSSVVISIIVITITLLLLLHYYYYYYCNYKCYSLHIVIIIMISIMLHITHAWLAESVECRVPTRRLWRQRLVTGSRALPRGERPPRATRRPRPDERRQGGYNV